MPAVYPESGSVWEKILLDVWENGAHSNHSNESRIGEEEMPTLRSVETKSPVHAAIVENLRNIQRYSGETASLICASRWEDAQLLDEPAIEWLVVGELE